MQIQRHRRGRALIRGSEAKAGCEGGERQSRKEQHDPLQFMTRGPPCERERAEKKKERKNGERGRAEKEH